jgi:hypothetical protein
LLIPSNSRIAVAATALAGCSDNNTSTPAVVVTPTVVTDTQDPLVAPPVVSGTPVTTVTTDTTVAVTDALFLGELSNVSFDSASNTLAVQIALDGSDTLQQYVADGTVNGYARFLQQDDPLVREFKAFAREADDGLLSGVVVMDGGQFNRFLGGGSITQDSYTAVTTGLASYAGDYVGLSNVGSPLGTSNGADSTLVPASTTEITGTVFLNVDFADSKLNGSIYDRVFDPDGAGIDLQSIILTASDIDTNGQFVGTVEFEDMTGVGDYNGAFGGAGTPNIASIVSLTEGFLGGATVGGVETTLFDDVTGEAEYGVFVLGQCPAGGADCLDAN